MIQLIQYSLLLEELLVFFVFFRARHYAGGYIDWEEREKK